MSYQPYLYLIHERLDAESTAGKHCKPKVLVHLTDTMGRDEEAVRTQAVADFVTSEEGAEYRERTDQLEVVVWPFRQCG